MIKKGKKIQRSLMFRDKININSFKTNGDVYKIISLENVLLESKTLEAGRILLSREWKKQGIKKKKIVIPCGFYIPYTKKGLQSRMGKGKGPIDKHLCHIHVYDPLFLFSAEGYTLARVLPVLKKLSYKLPFSLGVVDPSGQLYIK
jgi:large subunit ribosomal protein L16